MGLGCTLLGEGWGWDAHSQVRGGAETHSGDGWGWDARSQVRGGATGSAPDRLDLSTRALVHQTD